MFYTFHGKFYSIPFATFNFEVIDTINFQRPVEYKFNFWC